MAAGTTVQTWVAGSTGLIFALPTCMEPWSFGFIAVAAFIAGACWTLGSWIVTALVGAMRTRTGP